MKLDFNNHKYNVLTVLDGDTVPIMKTLETNVSRLDNIILYYLWNYNSLYLKDSNNNFVKMVGSPPKPIIDTESFFYYRQEKYQVGDFIYFKGGSYIESPWGGNITILDNSNYTVIPDTAYYSEHNLYNKMRVVSIGKGSVILDTLYTDRSPSPSSVSLPTRACLRLNFNRILKLKLTDYNPKDFVCP